MKRSTWRRIAVLIVAWGSFTLLLYGGFMRAPILDDVIWIVATVAFKPFWLVVAAAEAAVAVGLAGRQGWARTLGLLYGAWLLVAAVTELAGSLSGGAPFNPFALVNISLGLLLLYGLGARWRERMPRAGDGETEA